MKAFFAKFLMAGVEPPEGSEMAPIRDLVMRLQEENAMLKKQLDSNPVASAKHMRLLEVQSQLKIATSK